MRFDVLVIGAGPAGSAAAIVLAGAGARVAIADRAAFPRDKICGDGLLPDAVAALERLDVRARVDTVAQGFTGLRFRTPERRTMWLDVPGLVASRRSLDALLLERAREAGAEFLPGHSVSGFEGDAGRFTAARLATGSGEAAVEAGAFVLAAGAARRPRELAGLRRGGPPAVALRGYLRLPALSHEELLVAFERELPGGYAWAFPLADGTFNVGCGVMAGIRKAPSLSRVLQGFVAGLGGAGWTEEPHGAPLLTSFPGLEVARGNVLAVGDAAGLTRPFSGEGIGPALESGVLAARTLLASSPTPAAPAYRRALRRRFAHEFRAWRFGEVFLRFPALVELLAAKASRHPGARSRLAGLLGGTHQAWRVLSPLGLLRLFIGR